MPYPSSRFCFFLCSIASEDDQGAGQATNDYMVLAARETEFPASIVGVPESDTFQVMYLILHTPHYMHS